METKKADNNNLDGHECSHCALFMIFALKDSTPNFIIVNEHSLRKNSLDPLIRDFDILRAH